ncbi:MAG: glycosyltransferase family 2 protein [Hahellaceae bacterium]|jgi:glycosyltransferase involved in cell wall biosynthesis|nr:glycosyltransferase family 2 protein [Hahellaceae bacterium]
MIKLSVILITKNEADCIARCLDSVAFADEIIVVDSGSQDDTVDICKRYTEKVFATDWPGFGLQKQRALDQAKGEWVLSIDADEWVTPPLAAEIQEAIQQADAQTSAYEIPRLSSYCGRPMRHGGWFPDYCLRLFRREKGRFTPVPVHERIEVDGLIKRLHTPFQHEAFVDLEEVLRKVNGYSSLGARQQFEAGKRGSLSKAVLKGLWAFIRTYFLKAAFMDGREGFMLAVSNAEGTYYKYLKLMDLARLQRERRP